MFKKVLFVAVLLVAALVVFVSTRPADFVVQRSTMVKAPAQVVLGQVTDFHQWKAWSPWAKRDPG